MYFLNKNLLYSVYNKETSIFHLHFLVVHFYSYRRFITPFSVVISGISRVKVVRVRAEGGSMCAQKSKLAKGEIE